MCWLGHLQGSAGNSGSQGDASSWGGHGGAGRAGDPGASFEGCSEEADSGRLSGGADTGGCSGVDHHQSTGVKVRDLNFMEGTAFLAETGELTSIEGWNGSPGQDRETSFN